MASIPVAPCWDCPGREPACRTHVQARRGCPRSQGCVRSLQLRIPSSRGGSCTRSCQVRDYRQRSPALPSLRRSLKPHRVTGTSKEEQDRPRVCPPSPGCASACI